LKAVSGKEIAKVLERKGWLLQRVRGSHHIYASDDVPGVIVSVPIHGNRSLRIGTQRAIMRAGGLNESDL
jgi:predicted RNA binding protein YcfA (HicA-like mRNA interferase family)